MSNRELILSRVREAQPELQALPPSYEYPSQELDTIEQFEKILHAIGGQVHQMKSLDQIIHHLKTGFSTGRIVTTVPHLPYEIVSVNHEPHAFDNVTLAVISSSLAVAENGAVWVTEHDCAVRALPFIAENLAVLIHAKDIVQTMHHAYSITGNQMYGFGVFIAGPSKTADIEQSLVLGAHGSRSMQVYILH